MNFIFILIGIVFLCFIIAYILSITLIKNMKMYTSTKVEKFNFELEPKLDLSIFNEISRKFYDLGFKHDSDYKIQIKESKNVLFTRRVIFKESATSAIISFVMNHNTYDVSRDEQIVTDSKKYTFEICTTFNDGYEIISRENNNASIFKYDNKLFFECASIKEIDGLIREHLEAVREMKKNREIDVSTLTLDFETLLNKSFELEYSTQVKYGILKYNDINDYYYFTWKGTLQSVATMIGFMRKKDKNSTNPFMLESKNKVVKKTTLAQRIWRRLKIGSISAFLISISVFATNSNKEENAIIFKYSFLIISAILLIISFTMEKWSNKIAERKLDNNLES